MLKRKIGIFIAFLLASLSINGCGNADFEAEDGLSLLNEIIGTQDDSSLEINYDDNTADREEPAEGSSSAEAWDSAQILESSAEPELQQEQDSIQIPAQISRDGEYTSKDEVALYLYTYGELPSNFITKKEASELGWEGGSLEPYAPGKSIGGDYFGNYEGKLPKKRGREYHECDIDTKGASKRGSKRIVYSNDGLIYYTEDHYETYELLYGDEA